MSKFNVGDVIEPILKGTGFEDATVLGIVTEKKGAHKGKEMYLLKIINGTATIPCSIESNYQLVNKR